MGVSFETLEVHGVTLPLAIILDAAHQVQDSRGYGRGVVTTESRSGFHGGGTWVFPTRAPRFVVPHGYTSNWITLPGADR